MMAGTESCKDWKGFEHGIGPRKEVRCLIYVQ